MIKLSFCLLFSLVISQGCTFISSKESGTKDFKILQTEENFLTPPTYKGLPLHSGQIVVSESGNRYSLFFSLLPEHFSPHIHAGILIFDGDRPYVYEALGNLALFLGSQPTNNISGHIKRRPLERYISNENYTSIYNLPKSVDKKKIIQFALDHYRKATPFDPYTNTETHDSFYCTEFVAAALEASSSDPVTLTPYRKNSSIKKIRDWLKFVSDDVVLADSLVQPENHVVTLSSRLTLRELKLYILTRYELHRRFTDDQRLGNLFEWTGGQLKLRKPVVLFKERTMNLFKNDNKTPSWETTHLAVRNLADQMLGELPENDNTLKRVKLINYRIQ